MQIYQRPVILGDLFHKVKFYFYRVSLAGKPQFAGNPLDMRIHDNRGLLKYMGTDHVGGLSAHSGKRGEIVNIPRHFSAETVYKSLSTFDNVYGLHVEEAYRMNIVFKLLKIGICKVLKRGVFYEKLLSDFIDPGIGTLRAHYGRKEKLIGLAVV